MIDDLIHEMISYYKELHFESDRHSRSITEISLKQTIAKFYGDVSQLEYFLNTFIEEADRVLRDMYTPKEEEES